MSDSDLEEELDKAEYRDNKYENALDFMEKNNITFEGSKYENIISKYTDSQLVYERAIVLKQFNTNKKQLALLDEEYKRRLENGTSI